MAANSGESKKSEKSYLGSAVESINPWGGSRSATPTSARPNDAIQGNRDHSTTHLYGRSARLYPETCPSLNIRWFHAVDIPKRKPQFLMMRRKKTTESNTTPQQPKKFVAFSLSDSRGLEAAYQRLLEEKEDGNNTYDHGIHGASGIGGSDVTMEDASNTVLGESEGVRVPVNEDYLFDVDLQRRELAPAYWLGPVYEVRRGTWFFQEGSQLRPCEENLAAQLEEGYLKTRPWLLQPSTSSRGSTNKPGEAEAAKEIGSGTAESPIDLTDTRPRATSQQYPSHHLFGSYMNSYATYPDATTAWISSDSMISWVTSSVYERFSGAGFMSGMKVVRGYTDESNRKDEKTANLEDKSENQKTVKSLKRNSAPPVTKGDDYTQEDTTVNSASERESRLHSQLSSYMGSAGLGAEEQIRKREEQEIQDDYSTAAGDSQGRGIDHLILATHGIGQLLGLRMESVNFVHDVNTMRKGLKSVYSTSADLKAMNSESGEGLGNCKVQILPVCWRHLLDFPKQREKKSEHDLADASSDEDDYPSLEDITVEGVAFARSIISDLALDVLLYQSAYREQISRIVLEEANRMYHLFKRRNPQFKGKVHIMGHSLGSAIMFDILCRQKEKKAPENSRSSLRLWISNDRQDQKDTSVKSPRELNFDFDVENLICLGSPVGLFQMLKGRTIAARASPNATVAESPFDMDGMDDPFLSAPAAPVDQKLSPITGLPFSVSSPKVSQLFNIFHPSDPIAYRLEPLISPALSSFKPQVLPYTKKGILGSMAPQGLTNIGAKVGQSVTGLFSSLSAGIANSLLNRSLGLTNEEVAKMTASASQRNTPLQDAASRPGASIISDTEAQGEKASQRKRQLADNVNTMSEDGSRDMTLLDDELETLYSRFQSRQTELAKDGKLGGTLAESDATKSSSRARKVRQEDLKVRSLNRNGRVDYCIQESVLDFNPINTIASHMCYWADEDVNHFVLSQLLSSTDGATRKSRSAQ